jgi:putative selenium metabolism protein SsnA
MLLAGGTLLHLDPPRVEHADIRVLGDSVAVVGRNFTSLPDEEVVDVSGKWIMPGLVLGHHHLYSSLACGMPFLPDAPTSFHDMLKKVWWRLDEALDDEAVVVSALVGGLACLKAGVTTVVDHHASPSFITGSLEAMDGALANVGLRRVLCYEVTCRGGDEKAHRGVEAHRPLLAAGARPDRTVLVGVHANFTVTDDVLEACGKLAAQHDTGVHIHVAEAKDDQEETGEPLVDRLERTGCLRKGSVLAHCVHLSPDELKKIEDAGGWVAHQARSNMNNAVGYAPFDDYGPNTFLGTDGIDSDLFAELKTAYFRAQEAGAKTATPARLLEMLATSARFASERLGVQLGVLDGGAAADLVVLDPIPGPPLTEENLAASLVFRMSAAQVRSVMVGGRWRLKDREPVFDEDALFPRAEDAARAVWERMA